jgi:prepilin-type N-terminal cleavage/methylation domain-containing protein
MTDKRQGFSLIEVLIVVAIAAMVISVSINLGGNTTDLNGLVSRQLQSTSDINQTMQIMTTEIRSAGPSANGSYPIDSAGTSSFAFYTSIQKNGVMDYVKYFLSNSSIDKEVIAPTGTPATYPTSSEVITDLIDDVVIPTSTSLFTYYNSSYTGTQAAMTSTVDVSPIRLIGVSFYDNVDPNQGPGLQYFSILVDIRNLRSND